MSLIDFILNIAGLLLWLNWRASAMPATRPPGMPMLTTIKAAGPSRPRFLQWAGLPVLLAVRALFYWQVGPPVHWYPQIPLGPTALSFRSDLVGRMFLFSILGFAASLGVCYLWLLFLSAVNGSAAEPDPIQRLVRSWLGRLDRWPRSVKLLLPLAVAALAWLALHPLLIWLKLVPASACFRLLAQGVLIGLSAFLTLKYLLSAILILYLLNSYVYVGEFALWTFVNTTARRLLLPWQKLPARLWKIDFSPVLTVILILFLSEFAQRGLIYLYRRLL